MNSSGAAAEQDHLSLNQEYLLEAGRARASEFYDPALKYHNFEHALLTEAKAEQEIAYCRSQGLELDSLVVKAAAQWHDAGFNHPAALDYPSREAYAASLAQTELTKLGMAPAKVSRVCGAIISTQCDAPCLTDEDRAINRADLWSVAAAPEDFIYNYLMVWQEAEAMSGRAIDAQTRAETSYAILNAYAEKRLLYGEFDRGDSGRSRFAEAMRKNMSLLLPRNTDRYAYYVSKVWRGQV